MAEMTWGTTAVTWDGIKNLAVDSRFLGRKCWHDIFGA